MSQRDKHTEVFLEEASELLADLEQALLELEESPDDKELVGRIFRAMHTIKGSGAMFGFDNIAKFTHHVETVLDKVRDGALGVTKELIDLVLASRDQISLMLEEANGGETPDPAEADGIISRLNALMPYDGHDAKNGNAAPAHKKKNPMCITKPNLFTYHIRFKPSGDIFLHGMDPAILLDDLRDLGDCQVSVHTGDIPTLDKIDPETCYSCWDIVLTSKKEIEYIKDVFIFVEDDSEVHIREVADETTIEDGDAKMLLGEILVERGDIKREVIETVMQERPKIGELLTEKGLVPKSKVEAALAEQRAVDKRLTVEKNASVRVPADRLDKLINLAGEMVISQARLSQVSSGIGSAELASPVEEIERLTAELRDIIMGIRMMPIGTTFSKFKRLVRDLSLQVGKEIELQTDGAETELDKTVLERLNDPLVHLIRNSIDHGVELPEVREAHGKSRMGKVLLSAAQSGDKVVITVEDDGAGLNEDAIRAKAIEKKLIDPNSEIHGRELFNLIFAPGFSTAKVVSSISGRGVGMDVVKREIDSLRGTVEITSAPGKGTVISISLPLTLAIIDGLMVNAAGSSFVVPLSFVEECMELSLEDRSKSHGRQLAYVRGEIVPYLRLRDAFGMDECDSPIEHIVIVRVEGERVGIVVDNVIGDYQTVIKSLGNAYREADCVSGATIMGNGKVALILDVVKLVQSAELEAVSNCAA